MNPESPGTNHTPAAHPARDPASRAATVPTESAARIPQPRFIALAACSPPPAMATA